MASTTNTWWRRRVQSIADAIEAGTYDVPAEEVAHAMMFGRPRWGKDPVLIGDPEPDPERAAV